MQFESRGYGDAIAAPFCPEQDLEDALFEGLGGRSWNRIDSRADQADADLRRPQRAAVDWGFRHNEPVRWLAKPNPWGRRTAAVMSWVIDLAIEGLALSAATFHPEFLLPLGEHGHCRELGRDHPDGPGADTAPTNFAVWRAWIHSITSMVAGLRSKMRRHREIRRISAAWVTMDDRTLKDIEISRYEIEYARDARIGADVS